MVFSLNFLFFFFSSSGEFAKSHCTRSWSTLPSSRNEAVRKKLQEISRTYATRTLSKVLSHDFTCSEISADFYIYIGTYDSGRGEM